MNFFWLFLLASFSWLLTNLLCRYALAKNLIDVPNNRSSHSIATPRGGGLSIVISFLLGLFLLQELSFLDKDVFLGFLGAGLIVAIVGFIDDHKHIAARWRLLGHFVAASWLVFMLGNLPSLMIFGVSFSFGLVGLWLTVITLVWLLNLYNFMDGIDGLASAEALSSTVVAALLLLFVFDEQEIAYVNLLMFAAVLGFILWNWPPAKIFMGDAGSGFLGLMLGALALINAHAAPSMLWVWLILLGVFIVDGTYTLIRRLLRGDKVYEAHRSHAYQNASRKHSSHLNVTLSVLLINICWLTPWSVVVSIGLVDGALALILAYIPLLWLAWHFHAGALEKAP